MCEEKYDPISLRVLIYPDGTIESEEGVVFAHLNSNFGFDQNFHNMIWKDVCDMTSEELIEECISTWDGCPKLFQGEPADCPEYLAVDDKIDCVDCFRKYSSMDEMRELCKTERAESLKDV